MGVKSIRGAIIASANPEALAAFYGEALGLCFERGAHDGLLPHFGVHIGPMHFGIHPPENLSRPTAGCGTISLAFDVDSLEDTVARLERLEAVQVIAPHDEGFGRTATYADPLGNHFEIVEMACSLNAELGA